MLAAQQPVSDDGAFLEQFPYQAAGQYQKSPFLWKAAPKTVLVVYVFGNLRDECCK